MDVLKTIQTVTGEGRVWVHIMDTGTVLFSFDTGRTSVTIQMKPEEAVQVSKSICEVVAAYDLLHAGGN